MVVCRKGKLDACSEMCQIQRNVTLLDIGFNEALDIANQLIRLRGEVEGDIHSNSAIPRTKFHKKNEIDKLAKRAKGCALKMGGKTK